MASSDWYYLSDDGQRKVCGAITLRIVDLLGHIEIVGIMRNIGVGNSSEPALMNGGATRRLMVLHTSFLAIAVD